MKKSVMLPWIAATSLAPQAASAVFPQKLSPSIKTSTTPVAACRAMVKDLFNPELEKKWVTGEGVDPAIIAFGREFDVEGKKVRLKCELKNPLSLEKLAGNEALKNGNNVSLIELYEDVKWWEQRESGSTDFENNFGNINQPWALTDVPPENQYRKPPDGIVDGVCAPAACQHLSSFPPEKQKELQRRYLTKVRLILRQLEKRR